MPDLRIEPHEPADQQHHLDEEEHDPAYVYYLLVHETERIQQMASGSATPIINKGSFSKIEVEVHPPPVSSSGLRGFSRPTTT